MNGRISAAIGPGLAPSPSASRAGSRGDHDGVILLNVEVPGRARLHVPRLYRNDSACAAFVHALRADPYVRRVDASALTGNALVLFEPACDLDDIVARVAANGLAAHEATPSSPAPDNANGRVLHPDFASRRGRIDGAPAVRHAPMEPSAPAWHALDVREVLLAVGSSKRRGLSDSAARRRWLANGANRLEPPERRSTLSIFVEQFKSLPVALLAASAAASVATGGIADAVVILGVVLLNAGIGYQTESQTEREIGALNEQAQRHALVLRNAELRRIDASELVTGDILVLTSGAYVPADARVIETRQLYTDESALTGESVPAEKSAARLAASDVALADRRCMVYMGTTVVAGSGLAVVVATGKKTEIGTIQTLVGTTRPPPTPMQRQLEHFGNQTVRLASAVCGLVFVLGLLRGLGLIAMFKASVSLAVAAVPEGLPTVATTTLALGIRRMRRQKVLVRRLDAVETLGAVHTMCFDKTGTLTFNRMRVVALHTGMERGTVVDGGMYCAQGRLDPGEDDEMLKLLHVSVLCNEAEVNGGAERYQLNGSSTEIALVELALAAGVDINALRARHPLHKLSYRAEGRNYMTTVHGAVGTDDRLLAVKGNPAEVLALCQTQATAHGERVPLDEAARRAILKANDEMGGEALRMLGFAYAAGDATLDVDSGGLCWLGMLGLADPIRDGAKDLIALFRGAGIKTVIITGDQSATANAVGRTLGMGNHDGAVVAELSQISGLDDAAFASLAQRTDIFARVSAANKLQIVRGLQRAGEVIAMVGDGINDGPALKAADISVAMGRHSTDLAREVADVVLEDDNLQTLAVAISQGRTIYHNIRKSVHFLVSTNISEIVVTLAAVGAGLGQPLTPMQLLWINLLSDVFPALALAVEPPEPDVLRTPPREPGERIVKRSDMLGYGKEALVISAGAMASHAFAAARHGAGGAAGTVSFMTLTLAQLLHAYSCRSEVPGKLNILTSPRNRYLDMAIGGSIALQLLLGVIPGLRGLLGVSRIDVVDALAVGLGATVPYLVNESSKRAPSSTTDFTHEATRRTDGMARVPVGTDIGQGGTALRAP